MQIVDVFVLLTKKIPLELRSFQGSQPRVDRWKYCCNVFFSTSQKHIKGFHFHGKAPILDQRGPDTPGLWEVRRKITVVMQAIHYPAEDRQPSSVCTAAERVVVWIPLVATQKKRTAIQICFRLTLYFYSFVPDLPLAPCYRWRCVKRIYVERSPGASCVCHD